ncbi:aldehyde dehydrogenase (NADP(+)) [Chitinophaga costaii]|nr:aldehyde dehydrogenase (NADP(+)) [Chitinophaga costaii]
MPSEIEDDIKLHIDTVMQNAQRAFALYRQLPGRQRCAFLYRIAEELELQRDRLVEQAHRETFLSPTRLQSEIGRTTRQLKMFGDLIAEGSWVEAAIDTAENQAAPASVDIRKMQVPLGPVIVFGASNFPFAFSTAGGDTASALAAGATVVIKGHPAHPETSRLVFEAIKTALEATNMPAHTVQHVATGGNHGGKLLVVHPYTKAVAFTGSQQVGLTLLAYARERIDPIPIFAEMGSVNPVVFYPDALTRHARQLATQYAQSITMGVGQFCTNPGLLMGIQGQALQNFLLVLGMEMGRTAPQKMLHTGIAHHYATRVKEIVARPEITVLTPTPPLPAAEGEGVPVLASIEAADFLQHTLFTHEIFGPFSLVVICQSAAQLQQVLQHAGGQLTTTMVATDSDITFFAETIAFQQTVSGRVILNQAPTGVEVCASMVHGGPYPATTDARFTSVGTSAIKRWVRPVCYQNFKDSMLPDALKNSNPLGILRLVNNQYTREGGLPVQAVPPASLHTDAH